MKMHFFSATCSYTQCGCGEGGMRVFVINLFRVTGLACWLWWIRRLCFARSGRCSILSSTPTPKRRFCSYREVNRKSRKCSRNLSIQHRYYALHMFVQRCVHVYFLNAWWYLLVYVRLWISHPNSSVVMYGVHTMSFFRIVTWTCNRNVHTALSTSSIVRFVIARL